jgi:serine/threonine protein kinase
MPHLTNHDIDRYHVLERLGEGGMATVYKVYDTYNTRLEPEVAEHSVVWTVGILRDLQAFSTTRNATQVRSQAESMPAQPPLP